MAFPLITRGTTHRAVRKHRAPNGALRLANIQGLGADVHFLVRKHRAPNGALRPGFTIALVITGCVMLESTERHKVH